MPPVKFQQLSNFIWLVAELLRGPYRLLLYEGVMLPLTVLLCFDCVLEPTKERTLNRHAELTAKELPGIEAILNNLDLLKEVTE
ncbi:MAG: hypothetical protein JZU70_02720 [Chlorobium sp.]|jgi:type I restriction enzyme M protein|nr:hypothetical protein [Chlorobium sp.]